MQEVTYQETLFDIEDAILNEGFEGFKEDYLILHSLIRKYNPETLFEIGTCSGIGTNIICNAMKPQFIKDFYEREFVAGIVDNKKLVYSLDLPPQEAYKSEQYNGGPIGENCKRPYTQLRGDSLKFDFSKYPCEGYFIDGEHTTKNVYHESYQILTLLPKLTIWHDSDIDQVMQGITQVFDEGAKKYYDLFRVTGTRIAYCLKKIER